MISQSLGVATCNLTYRLVQFVRAFPFIRSVKVPPVIVTIQQAVTVRKRSCMRVVSLSLLQLKMVLGEQYNR